MKFHYALVDDLIDRDEFERRVEEKIAESGDLLDDQTAAMLVVREMGRSHVRIRDLSPASSLACFFARVFSVGAPREFQRSDGTKGMVANLIVGDETGRIRVVLWGEKAEAVHEIETGDALEILGRVRDGGARPEVHALALQKAACQITCGEDAGVPEVPASGGDLEVRLIGMDPQRTFTRSDGSRGEMVEAVIGNGNGVARLVCWAPHLLAGFKPGSCIRITGAAARITGQGVEYSLGETGTVTPSDATIDVPITPLAAVREGGSYAVAGTIVHAQSPRSFTTRAGTTSWVRNLVISDGSSEMPLVLWGERAQEHLVPGDRIEAYNAAARRGRYGNLELSLGRGSALIVRSGTEGEAVEVSGTVIATRMGTCLDTGTACYLLDEALPVGLEVRVTGTALRGVITVHRCEAVDVDPAPLLRRLDRFVGT